MNLVTMATDRNGPVLARIGSSQFLLEAAFQNSKHFQIFKTFFKVHGFELAYNLHGQIVPMTE